MKVKYIGILLLALLAFYGCDDNTGTLGMGMLPDSDGISAQTKTFEVSTKSILAGPVYAKTSTGYVGTFTDPDPNGFGNYKASFLTELNCADDFRFPAEYNDETHTGTMAGDTVSSAQLTIYYASWYGDSLNPCRMSVYELNRRLTNNHYTDINPEDYFSKETANKPNFTTGYFKLHKAYTAYDTSVPDSVRNATDSNGNSLFYPNVTLPLSKEFGNELLQLNRAYQRGENKFFENSDKFIDNVLKGVYIETDYGDGTILYVDRVDLQMQFRFHYVDSLGVKLTKKDGTLNAEGKPADSLYYSTATVFASTKEVVQANRFENSPQLEKKVTSDSEKGWSYLKSPAGIFTEATLPYDKIHEELTNDTLNAVKLTFTNYNQENNNKYKFSMSAPETVLLLRKKDMDTFFVNNELTDNVTSFVATHNSVETNQYTFKNIARLVSACINEKKAAKQKAKEDAGAAWDEAAWEAEWSQPGGEGENWDKVVLIPVVVTYDTNSTTPSMIGIQHDLKPTYAKLKGGDPTYGGSNLQIEVTYTSFNK